MTEHTDKLRPVEINGHQEFYTGYFHAWAGLSEHPTAIIETSNGRIKIVPAVQVTFTTAIMWPEQSYVTQEEDDGNTN